jgi:hypothetical protein
VYENHVVQTTWIITQGILSADQRVSLWPRRSSSCAQYKWWLYGQLIVAIAAKGRTITSQKTTGATLRCRACHIKPALRVARVTCGIVVGMKVHALPAVPKYLSATRLSFQFNFEPTNLLLLIDQQQQQQQQQFKGSTTNEQLRKFWTTTDVNKQQSAIAGHLL